MNQSTFGTRFTVSTWGESHGPALGVVIDGCPAGLDLCEGDIQAYLDRRKPGQSRFTTARKEEDRAEILSGVFEGKTTGTPISILIRNKDHRSADYGNLAAAYRPGHADFTFDRKFGLRDYRGGGRSSARETAARVAAGAVAAKLLSQIGVQLQAYTKAIGPVWVKNPDPAQITLNPLYMPDAEAAARAQSFLDECIAAGDSSGGVIECRITGMPTGLGEPVFGKLDACLAQAMMSIGAVKAVEIGDGIAVAGMKGSEDNDAFFAIQEPEQPDSPDQEPLIVKTSNHAGGIMGGISDGSDIILRAYIKPTPSISIPQQTATREGKNIELQIKGRHDPVIVPRAVVVVEAMAALVLADALLMNMTSRMDYIRQIYG
ncbi:MAG: chorismate synthase [Blautia sp.]|nr:chorismate synthase [Blautia sp.]